MPRGETSVSFKGLKFKNSKEKQFLEFVCRGTRANQLFLTSAIKQNVKQFDKIYDWFAEKLVVVFPESKFSGLEITIARDQQFSEALTEFFSNTHTGIAKVCFQEVEVNHIDIPPYILSDLEENLGEGYGVIASIPRGSRYLFTKDESNILKAFALATVRQDSNGKEIYFDVGDESDGTQRLLDIFPAFYEMTKKERIYVVDEIERSLHPNLVQQFLRLFLNSTPKGQLIVTTHESNLLDFDLLRRDEIWFMEKTKSGASTIYSLEEFAPRSDFDIQKGYLLGRYGGIPNLPSSLEVMKSAP